MSRLDRRIARWLLHRTPVIRRIVPNRRGERGAVDHVVILDGTNSSLTPGDETNAGMLYKLFRETTPRADLNLHYEAGIAWDTWGATLSVISGNGINGRIKRAYGAIASRYQPGDRIFLIGFSRGGYAVRSLAGIIGRVGLLQSQHATERNIRQVFRHYEFAPSGSIAKEFSDQFCQKDVSVELIAVWDTVKSLGFRIPIFWRLATMKYQFHNHRLGEHVKNGFHALALDETRDAFSPVLWESPEAYPGKLEQVWFRGSHGAVGGQLTGFNAGRAYSNVPFVWMARKVERCGAKLPKDWEKRFEVDPLGRRVGAYRGWAKAFIARHRRTVGRDPSEYIHSSVLEIAEAGGRPAPDLPVAPEE